MKNNFKALSAKAHLLKVLVWDLDPTLGQQASVLAHPGYISPGHAEIGSGSRDLVFRTALFRSENLTLIYY